MNAGRLRAAGYARDPGTRVWARPGYAGIAYSDGDEPETRIGAIIAQASDLSPLSPELTRQATDWPSRYHLSGARANLLRPFADALRGDVLEIGAGCGAITRFLGECGGNVLALEGSPRRAAIAASRTRDLDRVCVVADDFAQFEWPDRFDAVTVIGVLEYANLYFGEVPAPLAMLRRVRALLKPGGALFLAIENQLGLKYFAGAIEDHVGIPMYGIEARYRPDQPQTFGRAALAALLRQAGFETSEFYLPFPDYKLPASIVAPAGLRHPDFDAAAFAWQSARRDPQLPALTHFSLELAWPTIFANGLAPDLANSFLVAAAPAPRPFADPNVLAVHYSTGRRPRYCKETVFRRGADGRIGVAYRRLAPAAAFAPEDGPLRFVCPDAANYGVGRSLSLDFFRRVSAEGWRMAQVAEWLRRYLEALRNLARTRGAAIDEASPHALLPGSLLDAIPRNMIVRPDGGIELIDEEWARTDPIEFGFLPFRSLMMQLWETSRFGANGDGREYTHGAFLSAAFAAAGLPLDAEDFRRYVALEAEIQNQIAGFPAFDPGDVAHWLELPLQSDYEAEIARLQSECAEQIGRMGAQTARLTAEKTAALQDLAAVHRSWSWRLTAPVRALGRGVRRLHRGALAVRHRLVGALPPGAQRALHRAYARLRPLAAVGAGLFALPFRLVQYALHPGLRAKALNALARRWAEWRQRNRAVALPDLDWVLRKLELDVDPGQIAARIGPYLTRADEAVYGAMIGELRAAATGAASAVVRAADLEPEVAGTPPRRRILFVCGEFPNPVHGGGSRVADFIKALAADHDVYVAAWYDPLRDHAACAELEPHCRRLLKLSFEELEAGCADKLLALLDGQPADVVHYEWPRALNSFDRRLGRHHLYTHMEAVSCSLWIDLRRMEPLSPAWLRRLAQLLVMLKTEILDVKQADAQIVVTAKDGEFLSRFAAGQTFYVVNHGINRTEFDVPDQPAEPRSLVFTGNFIHYPNVDAVHWFMRDVRPRILASVPDLRVWLVGAHPPAELQRYHDGAGVVVTGRVPDVRPYVQKAAVCIAPLVSGAGLRTKVVQYAALRRPCVATSIAVEDLGFADGRDVFVADAPETFADRVVELLLDPARAAAMAASARARALDVYDNQRIARRDLGNLYRRLDAGKEPR